LLGLNRYGAARISFSRATHYSPDSAYAWYFYGATLEKTGDLKKALESLNKSLSIEENANFLTDRGRILRQLGEYDAALASYDRALELDPHYESIWLNRGALLCDYLGRSQEALACFQRALEITPDNHLAWYNHGNVLRKLGQYEEAIDSYEKAIELQPNYSCALYERDWLVFLTQYQQCQTINYDLALKLVKFTIEVFVDQSIQEEKEIEDFLIGRGVQEIHAEDLVSFIPIAFGRVYLSEKAVILSPEFIWIQMNTGNCSTRGS
jgi:tetratricopeptide (TPR) repeat protein